MELAISCLEYICDEFERDNLPKDLASFIWLGIGLDYADDWTEEQFFIWVNELEKQFPQYTSMQLISYYDKVTKLTQQWRDVNNL